MQWRLFDRGSGGTGKLDWGTTQKQGKKASEEWLSGWNDPSHQTYSHVCPTALERRLALVRWAEEQLEGHQRIPGSTEES